MATKVGSAMTALVAGALLLPAWVPAHEAGDRAKGVVEQLDEASLQVRTPDGHVVTFAITGSTRFLRGAADAKRTDVKLGERAVVEGRRAGERLEAVRVKLGAAPREHAPH